jgi:hypothetical protein
MLSAISLDSHGHGSSPPKDSKLVTFILWFSVSRNIGCADRNVMSCNPLIYSLCAATAIW